MTGEQVRWGWRTWHLDQKSSTPGLRRDAPLSTSCTDHGLDLGRVHTWDGKQWKFISRLVPGRRAILIALVKAGSKEQMSDKKMTRRDATGLPVLRTSP